MIGVANHEKIGRDRVTHQARCQLGRIQKLGVARSDSFLDFVLHRAHRELQIRVAGEIGGHHQRGIDQRTSYALLHLGDRFIADPRQDVAGEHELRLAGRNSRGVELLRGGCDTYVRDNSTVFLRETGHIENRHAFAFEVRRHAEERSNGDHPCAPDAGDQNPVGFGGACRSRLG